MIIDLFQYIALATVVDILKNNFTTVFYWF